MEIGCHSSSNGKNPSESTPKKKKRQFKKEMQRFGFAEMNLLHQGNPEKTLQLVKRAIQMGYDTVVINVDVGDLNPVENVNDEPPKKKKKKAKKAASEQQQTNVIPDPFLVDESKLDLSQIEADGKKFRQFSRLTVTLNDSIAVHKLQNHSKRALYDIVAIRCSDENMLTTMTRKGELFDIITMDSKQHQDGRIPWIYKQKLIQACISDGISFELCYGEALQNNAIRRQFLINGRALGIISRNAKGIILSSGAELIAQLRGTLDVANMCTLFGMKLGRGNKLVSENCCQALLRSQSRRTIKGALHIAEVNNAPAPPNIKQSDHLTELLAIPEFREQMKPKPRLELTETS